MNYLEIKTLFNNILNRRDITPSLTTQFVDMGLRKVQRVLRVPPMETTVTFTVDDAYAGVPVPNDMVELISLDTQESDQPRALRKVSLQAALLAARYPGLPEVYARQAGFYIVGALPSVDTVFYLTYYQAIPDFTDDTSTNWLSNVAPDLLAYAALTYAADYYLDDRKTVFDTKFVELADELQSQANMDDMAGQTISATYQYDLD